MTRWETWGYVVLAFVSCALHYGVPTVSAGLFDIAAALAVRSLLRLLTRRLDPSSTGRAALTIHPPTTPVGATAAPGQRPGRRRRPPTPTPPFTHSHSPCSPATAPPPSPIARPARARWRPLV